MTTQENTSKGSYEVYIKMGQTEAEMFDDSGADISIIRCKLAMKVIQENPGVGLERYLGNLKARMDPYMSVKAK